MTVGVTVLSCDRNVFKWTWEDEELRGCVHVDDVLFAGGARVRGEFLRRVSTHIDITSNDEPCTTFCGYSFTYDDHQQTISNSISAENAWQVRDVGSQTRIFTAEGRTTTDAAIDRRGFKA